MLILTACSAHSPWTESQLPSHESRRFCYTSPTRAIDVQILTPLNTVYLAVHAPMGTQPLLLDGRTFPLSPNLGGERYALPSEAAELLLSMLALNEPFEIQLGQLTEIITPLTPK